ncbi:hypothetical protein LNTAR_15627 [Lentisphaera araneosa HTCC2155]|uniref:Uncharacterized protein n=1 Tax=Lentisphaera araneosa HTCC2155 TaxID=313628 RepID=A6DMC3_9BACT|nr:type II secretion system protein [Lentisphaera araneosa]EDM27113.1 hypothetical protein LNTAR_15627 [Lentisphaera araneosa HTCC2155]
MKKRYVSLIEVLVVIAVIAILASLLLPSLRNAREQAKSANCLSNLRNLGMYTHMSIVDNDGDIPASRMFYEENYTGDRSRQAWRWHTFLGEYINSPSDNLFKAEVFSCPSHSIHTRSDNGDPIDGALTYWVNSRQVDGDRELWMVKSEIDDSNPADNMRITEILSPGTLASIYDVAQDWVGKVAESGAGGFISHGPGIWDAPWPRASMGHDPNLRIAYKDIPKQDGIHYWRGAIDFRHPRESMNTVNFDGSGSRLLNGGVRNKNMVNQ